MSFPRGPAFVVSWLSALGVFVAAFLPLFPVYVGDVLYPSIEQHWSLLKIVWLHVTADPDAQPGALLLLCPMLASVARVLTPSRFTAPQLAFPILALVVASQQLFLSFVRGSYGSTLHGYARLLAVPGRVIQEGHRAHAAIVVALSALWLLGSALMRVEAARRPPAQVARAA